MIPFSDLTPDDFTAGAQRSLPRGAAWPRDPDALLTSLTAALAARHADVHRRAVQLLEVESDPRQTVLMLPEWERAYGLPDPCTPLNATLQQRRAALVAKIVSVGGQSRAYFIEVAATLGYAITIEEFMPSLAGVARCGDRLRNISWRFAWRVHAPATTSWRARAGASRTGEHLGAHGNGPLECVLNRLKPAHTILQFAYGS
jgi:uncharacterized protein YmfQ (DUF2313 family)